MSLQLDSLIKSIEALERSVKIASRLDTFDDDLREVVRAGVIQSFEVAYEQCRKMIDRWLQENIGRVYVDGIARRDLFRMAAESRLITDAGRWMEYHIQRNLTSHTYNEDTAQDVFKEATQFTDDAKHLLRALEARND